MTGVFAELSESHKPEDCYEDTLIVDSIPIMNCTGKVATKIADKGYRSTKNQYYHRLNVCMMRKGHIPFTFQLALPYASENDLSVFKRGCASAIRGKTFFADKIYRDATYWRTKEETKGNLLISPIKAVKGATDEEKQRNRAADDFYSSAASPVTEPVEAFFNWLNETTNIQRVTSAGLLPDF